MATAAEPVVFAKVDAVEETELATRYGVAGYPTLKYFSAGKVEDYDGPRTPAGIREWLSTAGARAANSPVVPLESAEMLTAITTEDPVVVVAHVKGGEEAAAYEKLARSFDSTRVTFLSTDDASLFGDVESSRLILLKHYDERRAEYPGSLTDVKAMETFVTAHSHELLVNWVTAGARNVFDGGLSTFAIAVSDGTEAGGKLVNETLLPLAQETRDSVVFIVTDMVEAAHPLEFFSVDSTRLPTVVLVTLDPKTHDVKSYRFREADTFSAAGVRLFLDALRAGELKQSWKSEPVPGPEAAKSPLLTVVGDTFTSLVLENTAADVLMEFYAPWCGHCKKLAPLMKKLAARYANVPELVIAQMDATANEHPMVKVRGYPTLMFYPKDKTLQPFQYEGDRNMAGFVAFLKKHSAAAAALE